MSLADTYKRRAAECVQLAEQASDPADKARYLQMADSWLHLAAKVEDQDPPARS
jgi:hypothetical protein